MKTQKMIIALVATVSFASVGCGQGFQSGGSNANTAASVGGGNAQDNISQAAVKSASAQTAAMSAQSSMATVQDSSGNIDTNLFSGLTATSLLTQGLLAPILTKLQPVLDKVYSEAQTVKADFEAAKTSLNTALVALDPSVSANAAQIASINQQILAINQMEMQFETLMHQFSSKLQLANTTVDTAVNNATSKLSGTAGIIATIAADLLVLQQFDTFMQGYVAKFAAL